MSPARAGDDTATYEGRTALEWVEIFEHEPARRDAAASALGAGLGGRARAAVPALVRLLDDQEMRLQAASVLSQIGLVTGIHDSARQTVPVFLAFLDDPELLNRQRAIIGLGELRENAMEAVPALQRRLADPDVNARQLAACSLALITGERYVYEGMRANSDPKRDAIQHLAGAWMRLQRSAGQELDCSSKWVGGPDEHGIYRVGARCLERGRRDEGMELRVHEAIRALSAYLIVQGFLVEPSAEIFWYEGVCGNDPRVRALSRGSPGP